MQKDSDPGEGVRRRNLARILRLLHFEGASSRATLTAATGLNRSTIADLVAELAGLGLVTAQPARSSGRAGRPSPVVAVTGDVVAIAVNPEVDAIEMAAVTLDGSVVVHERVELDHLISPEETASIVARRSKRWREAELSGCRVVSIGIAVPGLVRTADGLVRHAPHLNWVDAPVRELVTSATGVPTVIGNDASLGARAEHLFGAGRGVGDLIYLNGGASGIGGGLVIGGVPVRGADGYAGEFGHNRLAIAAAGDRRSADGVFEAEVSRARLLEVLGLSTADERTLAAAVGSTDASARTEVRRQRRILATGLANSVNVINPAVVVLGGFLATLAAVDLEGLHRAVRAQAMPASAERLQIRVAALGENRLLIGAAEAAFTELLQDPRAALALPHTHECGTGR